MAQGLILFLILFPMAMAPVVFPLRRRDRGYRDRFIQLVPVVELAAALALLAFPGGQAELAGDLRTGADLLCRKSGTAAGGGGGSAVGRDRRGVTTLFCFRRGL